MRLLPAVTVFVAAGLCFVVAGSEAPERHLETPKCDRAFGRGNRVIGTTCTYICQGWPMRSENEQDGVSCGILNKGVCLNGKCVDIQLYPTTAAQAPSSPSSIVPHANAPPPTSDTPPKNDNLFVNEETTLTTNYENVEVSSNSNVRAATHKMLAGSRQTAGDQAFTAPLSETSQGHSVGSSFPTRRQARTTLWEITTTRAPTSWEERPAVMLNTVGERTLTSSSHQDDRLSPRTEDTTITEISASSTEHTGSEDASSLSIVDSSVAHGETNAHYDGLQASTRARQEGWSTDGPTALSRQLVTSSGPNSEDFGALSTHTGSPFGTVSDEIPGFRVNTNEPTASIFDSMVSATSTAQDYAGPSEFSDKYRAAAVISHEDVSTHHPSSPGRALTTDIWSTYDESSITSARSGTKSGGIESSSNALGHSSALASATASAHNAGTRASTDKEQAVTETEGEDISMASLTTLDSLLSDFSSRSRQNIASGSTDPEESFTTMSYATKAVTETSNTPVTQTAPTTGEKDDRKQGSPAHIRHLTPSRVTSEKLTSDSTSPRLSVGLSAFLTVLLCFSGLL